MDNLLIMKTKINSKEVGLDLGLLLFKNFLDTDYMHYGLFKDGLDAKIINLPKAQENYAELLLSIMPEGISSILEVGCGSGRFAYNLSEKGYNVECVTPQSQLADYAEDLLIGKANVNKSKYEDFNTSKKYDLILFSESFQYIKMKDSISKSIRLLNPGGFILIADFFQTDAEGKSALGGGHKFSAWQELLSESDLEVQFQKDVTDLTAPTIDIADQLSKELAFPIWKLILNGLGSKYPTLLRFLRWKYANKINKIEHTYFSGEMNGDNFKKYKKYMIYLIKKN